MNELKEKEEKQTNEESIYTGTVYRRGARRKTKGNVTLAIVVIILAAIVIFGIFFAVRVFFSTDDLLGKHAEKKTNVVQNGDVSNNVNETLKEASETKSFSITADENGKFDLENKTLKTIEDDIDADGEDEMISVCMLADASTDISVYEKIDGKYLRNGYYAFLENVLENETDFFAGMYISEKDENKYICMEYFSDDKWELTVFAYDKNNIIRTDNILVKDNLYTDDIYEKIEKYGIKYCGKDYDETGVILNAKTEKNLCGFVKKNSTVEVNI